MTARSWHTISTVNSAQEAVDTVADQAILAAIQQTFAVGGAIINNATGEVIAAMHNNVLMPFPGNTRGYAVMRWSLMNDPDPEVRAQAEQYLTHPKYGTFVFLYAPDPTTPQAVMALGAYGSTMEGEVAQSYPSNLQYVLLPGNTTPQTLSTLAQDLPPFYTESVQVGPAQVLSQELINAVKNGV